MKELLELINQYSTTGKYDIEMCVNGSSGEDIPNVWDNTNISSLKLILKPLDKKEGIKSLIDLSTLVHKYQFSYGYKANIQVEGLLKGDSQVEKITINIKRLGEK